MAFLRHRGSGIRHSRPVSSSLGSMIWPPTESVGGGKQETMFRVLFRGPDLSFRLITASCFCMGFAYVGAFNLAFLTAVYFFCLLFSAFCYYHGSTFASSVVLCVSTTVCDLVAIAVTGGVGSAFVYTLTVCPSMTVYAIGPKSGMVTTAMLLPCLIAMAFVPLEWNELDTCLANFEPEIRHNIYTTIQVALLSSCTIVHCGLMTALMLNLQESYTERLKVRLEGQSVEEANKVRRDFVASISHELRTPMNAICGACETLLSECKSTDDSGWISLIDNSARTLLALVNDIISVVATQQYGSPGRKRIQLQSEPCDFIALLKEVVRTARLTPKPGVELWPLEVDQSAVRLCDPTEQRLLGDSDRFREVVSHLVSNAVKFTERGAVKVTLAARPTSPEGCTPRVLLMVAVADTGIGIAPDKLTEIFEPFAQGDGTATRRYGGTGVGLTISRNLAEIMKGSITVTSDIGRGSRFLFQCPVCVEKIRNSSSSGSTSAIVVQDSFSSQTTSTSSMSCSSSSSTTSSSSSSSSHHPPSYSSSCHGRSLTSTGSSRSLSHPLPTSSLIEHSLVVSPKSVLSDLTQIDRDEERKREVDDQSSFSDSSTEKSHSPAAKRKFDYAGCMCIVVDDNMVNVKVLSNHLRRLGLTVETAVNGEEAIEVAKKHGERASCIFMDIMMPVMDGMQATREIRRLGTEGLTFLRDIPIYACTTLDTREDFIQAGMNGSILKPVSSADIQGVFREIMVKPLTVVH